MRRPEESPSPHHAMNFIPHLQQRLYNLQNQRLAAGSDTKPSFRSSADPAYLLYLAKIDELQILLILYGGKKPTAYA